MTIKTIFFDFGGVIYKLPNKNSIQRWKSFLGIEENSAIAEILANPNESPVITDICLGKIPEDFIWVKMAEKWGIKPGLARRLRRRMMSKRSLNKPLLRYFDSLHASYQTAILSNAGDQSRSLMVDHLGLHRYVDEIIISAEEACIKPDPKIFKIAMERLETTPEESVFLDDYPVNVEAARQFGLHAVHFINTDQARQTIDAILAGKG